MNKKKSILESNLLYTLIAIVAGFIIGAVFLMIAGISLQCLRQADRQCFWQAKISCMGTDLCKPFDLYRIKCCILL